MCHAFCDVFMDAALQTWATEGYAEHITREMWLVREECLIQTGAIERLLRFDSSCGHLPRELAPVSGRFFQFLCVHSPRTRRFAVRCLLREMSAERQRAGLEAAYGDSIQSVEVAFREWLHELVA